MSTALSPVAATCADPMKLLSNGLERYSCGELPYNSYLTPQDVITFALPYRTVVDIGESLLWRRCVAVSSEFRGYARKRYKLPLLGWGAHVVEMLAFRAAGRSLSQRGHNQAGNPEIKDMYKEAGQWMCDVRDYKVDADVEESQPAVATPRCDSMAPRGW